MSRSSDWIEGFRYGYQHAKNVAKPGVEPLKPCPECGVPYKRLTEHLKKIHGWFYENNKLVSYGPSK